MPDQARAHLRLVPLGRAQRAVELEPVAAVRADDLIGARHVEQEVTHLGDTLELRIQGVDQAGERRLSEAEQAEWFAPAVALHQPEFAVDAEVYEAGDDVLLIRTFRLRPEIGPAARGRTSWLA